MKLNKSQISAIASKLEHEHSIKKKYVQGYGYISTMTNAEAYALVFAKKKETVNSKFTCGSIEEALTIASVDAADMDALLKNYEKFLI